MGVKNPQTYGDYYWRAQVEAEKMFQDGVEDEVSSYVKNMYDALGLGEALPPAFNSFVGAMTSKKSFAWGGILARFGSEMADSVLGQTMGHALKDFNYMMAETFSDVRITAAEATILYSRRKIDDEFFHSRMASEGLKPAEAAAFYGSRMPYPTIPDIIRWSRYHGDAYNIREKAWERFDIPSADIDIWDFTTQQVLSTGMITKLFRRELIGQAEAEYKLGEVGYSKQLAAPVIEDGWLMPNAMLLVQGNLMQGIAEEQIIKDISKADVHPNYASTYLDAVLTKPSSQDLIAYELRRDPSLGGLPIELKKIGIHPEYFGLYKELSYVIPPVADIITMAVREAFTPSIAAKFGQYQDFPTPFAEWGAKKGLSKEWCQRYWAAHWALPSAQQGFTMLHRGVITLPELNMLLRAQDVMPFWRDKLIQIAFRPLTRVDVRRMYREGVLDIDEVYKAYLDQGYIDENAKRMTEYTIKQTLSTQAKFTSSDVVSAYSKRMISRSEARSLLADLGMRSEGISYILTMADHKRSWAMKESKIRAIKNLYKKGVYTRDIALGRLYKLALPSDEVDSLMEQWHYEKEGELAPTWTKAETLRFIISKQISRSRGKLELERMGYDDEHINVYLEVME